MSAPPPVSAGCAVLAGHVASSVGQPRVKGGQAHPRRSLRGSVPPLPDRAQRHVDVFERVLIPAMVVASKFLVLASRLHVSPGHSPDGGSQRDTDALLEVAKARWKSVSRILDCLIC